MEYSTTHPKPVYSGLRILDLFCGGGGASVGYYLAGFNVVGVDIEDHPAYPFAFIQADATQLNPQWIASQFDAVHASPPCQDYTSARHLRNAQGGITSSEDALIPTRALLQATGLPYVIENVPGAPLEGEVVLCGSSFGLKVRRHRAFEANFPIREPVCDHQLQGKPVGVYGSLNDDAPKGGTTARSIEEAREAMGIDWMQWRSDFQEWKDIKEAVPPAYTLHVGNYLMSALTMRSEAHV